MKILDFFRKKNTEESSDREMDTDPLASRIRCNQDKIDEMLQNPGFKIYNPFLRVHRDTLAKRWAEHCELTQQLPIYNWQYEMTKSAYARDIVMNLIHNINLYIRVRKEESINFGILEMFLLATLACELKIPRVPIIIDETEIINVMESRDMKILYTHFMESRKELIGTDIEVIIDLVYRYDNDRIPDARFYRKTNIDEIRDLVNNPNFPDGYTEFALYNDHLLYNTWRDFRSQVNPNMTLAEYIKVVFHIVVVTHIYRMDTKHGDFRIKNGVICDTYYSTLLNACLEEHVCWFPSEEQTKHIIERREETIQRMGELVKSTVEKPFGEELPESVRKATATPSNTELPDDWNPVEKSWDEFRNTGLVQITNQFLHIFGWALTYEKDGDNLRVFPARVRYRGFAVDSQTRAYEKLQKYMIENAETLYKESDYEDEEN